jgi:hypothetical protein
MTDLIGDSPYAGAFFDAIDPNAFRSAGRAMRVRYA